MSLGRTNITIPPGPIPTDGSDCVSVTATDDTILETSEDFEISISGTCFPQVTVGNASTTNVTISDNDGTKNEILLVRAL